jgi:2-hydroxychromene-2-carboxylate isomerase
MAVLAFDFADPEHYLLIERIKEHERVPELVPARLGGPVFRCAEEVAAYREDLERRAAAQGDLLPIRWPDPFPFDSDLALLAATYAKKLGKVAAFSLAAFRQAYAGGRALDEETVLIAGAAAEIHPAALLKGIGLRSVREALAAADASRESA